MKSEVTDLKKTSGKSLKKLDAVEKEVRSLKTIVEEIQSTGVAGVGAGRSSGGSSRHSSTDVSLYSL